ncbi:helix-turn-helix domain-containing protein [Streptobacillus moniliformis]|uniref:helix-turn-helix domain-containing protein n=1 Tax=Streptobacillus moniliformis TaxID=34105 RepID=UPI0007E3B807|nr:helix-turn-helix transcriptional regulator [Streptobacillus moniliformis]
MVNIKLGNKIKEIRKSKKLKQHDLANILNLSVKSIQRYEKGINLTKNFIDFFCEKLNLNVSLKSELLSLLLKSDYELAEDETIYHLTKIYNLLGYSFEYKEIKGKLTHIIKSRENFANPNGNFLKNNLNIITRILEAFIEKELDAIDEYYIEEEGN